ncbi:MAG: ABC transporter ATP-binding protein [Phycisphaerae bacterium]
MLHTTPTMLEARNLCRRFGPTLALADVSVRFDAGSIHAVLGENGAGKSTLMHILYGLVRPDRGAVWLDGRPLRLRRPADAHAAGIGMVHQHFMLVERMTVAENVALGLRGAGFWRSPAGAAERAQAAARRVGLSIDPRARVEGLSVGQRQRVEILKALAREVSTLILDEPTAVLAPAESEQLFATLRRLRAAGCRVIFISHKLAEVVALADHVTVLRAGRVVLSEPGGLRSPGELAAAMVGAKVPALPRRAAPAGPESPCVATLPGGAPPMKLRAGEIVGVAGVDGNGQAELIEAVRAQCPEAAYIAADRHRESLALPLSVTENVLLKRNGAAPYSRCGWIDWRAARLHAGDLVSRHDVRGPGLQAAVSALSGGNQQKLVVARELSGAPRLVIAVNPTRGLDVAAARFVHAALLARRDAGAAVLLVSADLDEVLQLSDRVCVAYAGRLSEVRPDAAGEFDLGQIGRRMAGLEAGGP